MLAHETVFWDETEEEERGFVVGVCCVHSHARGADWSVC